MNTKKGLWFIFSRTGIPGAQGVHDPILRVHFVVLKAVLLSREVGFSPRVRRRVEGLELSLSHPCASHAASTHRSPMVTIVLPFKKRGCAKTSVLPAFLACRE